MTVAHTSPGCRSAHIFRSCLHGHSNLHLQLLARGLRPWTQMLLLPLQTVRAGGQVQPVALTCSPSRKVSG